MAEESFQETEQATPKRREDARRGTVARSSELSSVPFFLTGLLALSALGLTCLTSSACLWLMR